MTSLCNTVLADKYKLVRKIGSGSFGVVYLGENIETGDLTAVKLENSSNRRQYLPNEAKMYAALSGGIGIPTMHYNGVEHGLNVLVVQLLGPTLEQLFNFCSRNFSLKTILMLANQMISRLEFLHTNFVVHRDVKPDNFLMGLDDDKDKLYLIDFGLVKRFCDPQTKEHIVYRSDYDLIGTPRYASVNAHMGIEQSRRDDMESIGYTLLYFYLGALPWQGVVASNKKQRYEKIADKKMSVSLELLCRDAPLEFLLYMNYCRSLHFVEQPNYGYLRELFDRLFRGLHLSADSVFDWNDRAKENEARKTAEAEGSKMNNNNDNNNNNNNNNNNTNNNNNDNTINNNTINNNTINNNTINNNTINNNTMNDNTINNNTINNNTINNNTINDNTINNNTINNNTINDNTINNNTINNNTINNNTINNNNNNNSDEQEMEVVESESENVNVEDTMSN